MSRVQAIDRRLGVTQPDARALAVRPDRGNLSVPFEDRAYRFQCIGIWRLVEFHESGKLELYHLDDDLGESSNIGPSHPEKRSELLAKLNHWRISIAAQMPAPNPNHDPARETQVSKNNPLPDPVTKSPTSRGLR